MSSKKNETIYLSISILNIPSWFSYLHDLVLPRVLFEPDSDWRKTSKGCVEKVVETKLSIQDIKNNLQQLREISVFII